MKLYARGVAKRGMLWGLLCSGLLLPCAFLLPAHAIANSDSLETRVRAAFLFNFARYTEWPTIASRNDTHFHFCVAASSEIKLALEQTLQGKQILGLKPSIQLLQSAEQSAACQLLYLPDLPAEQMQAWLRAASDQDILLISEGRSFPQTYPGMVGFFLRDGRIRFAINPNNVKQSGLQMSSRLLGLADIIRGDE